MSDIGRYKGVTVTKTLFNTQTLMHLLIDFKESFPQFVLLTYLVIRVYVYLFKVFSTTYTMDIRENYSPVAIYSGAA